MNSDNTETDYSHHTLDELLEVKRDIDGAAEAAFEAGYDEAYDKLKFEIEERRFVQALVPPPVELQQPKANSENDEEPHRSVFSLSVLTQRFTIVNLLAVYQIVAGVILLAYAGFGDSSKAGQTSFLLTACLASFSVFCGVCLLKKTALGFNLSFINQFIQAASLSLGSTLFHYSCIGGFFLSLSQEGRVGLELLFEPGFQWMSNITVSEPTVAVDLIAVLILGLIRAEEKKCTAGGTEPELAMA